MDQEMMKIVEASMRKINLTQENSYAQVKDQNDAAMEELVGN